MLSKSCNNCGVTSSSYGWFQCPKCEAWMCLSEDSDNDSFPNCMVHVGYDVEDVCADCCIGYKTPFSSVGEQCSVCSLDLCDDCDYPKTGCVCVDLDDD